MIRSRQFGNLNHEPMVNLNAILMPVVVTTASRDCDGAKRKPTDSA